MQEITRYSEKDLVKLDLKDKKILAELDFNARISFSQLGKKVGLSKQGAEYKVRNLMKKGVIKGFYPVINVPKLGYKYCRLLVTLQNIDKDKYTEILNYLKNNKKVFWLFKMQGMYDLLIVMWANSLSEFKEFREDLEGKFGKYIKRKVENIATDVIHYSHRYLLGAKETQEINIKETSEIIKIDGLDKEIMKALCEDARMPLIEISKKVDESAKVVAYRIRGLEKKKIIECYRPIINHSKIGFTYYKIFMNLNNISKKELETLHSYVEQNSSVIYLVEGIALPADLEIEVMIESNQQLFDFIEDLKFKFPALIGDYQTVTFIETLKVNYLPF